MEKKKEFWIWMFVAIDFLLLVFLVFLGIKLIRDIVGPDIITYENWNGLLENPTVYRFGSGCWEVTVVIAKFILFCVLQKKYADKFKYRKSLVIVGVVLHLLILAAGLYYMFRFKDGNGIVMILQHYFGGRDF